MMRPAAAGLLSTLLLGLMPPGMRAQAAPRGVVHGDTVRVKGRDPSVVIGIASTTHGDTLDYVMLDGHDMRLTFGPSVRVSVLSGRQRHAGVGAAIGGLTYFFVLPGVAIGAAIKTKHWIPAAVPGARVRVQSRDLGAQPLLGVLTGIGPDTVEFRDDDRGGVHRVATSSGARIDVSDGMHGHPGRGALIGLGVGTLVGAIALSGKKDCREQCQAPLAIGIYAGNALGLLVGALARTERWVSVGMR